MFHQKSTTEHWDVLKTWVMGLSLTASTSQPTTAAFRYAVKKAIQRRQRLPKTKSEGSTLQEYLLQPFQIPLSASGCADATITRATPQPSFSESDQLKKENAELAAEVMEWKEKKKQELLK